MNYAVRLRFPFQSIAPWASRVSMACEKSAFYEHSGDPANIHIHALILGWSKDKTTLKNWLKETLNLTPARTQWVFSTHYDGDKPVDEGFLAYMSKGKYDPKYVKGFSDEVIAEAKAKGYDGKKNNDEKPDKNEKYWRSFYAWAVPDIEQDSNWSKFADNKFEVIRRWSYSFMMNNVSMPMPHDLARHKACVMRLAWELQVPLPDNDRFYKY